MAQPSIPSSTAVTFVVRFWREVSAGRTRWRGQIEHVPSGQSAAFLDLDVMLRFLHRCGVDVDVSRLPLGDEV